MSVGRILLMPMRVVLVLCSLAQFSLAGDGAATRFPGLLTELRSPNGRYLLLNTDSDVEPFHVLRLRDIATATTKELLSYERFVDVLWSAGGSGLIINDHKGSDLSNCIVLRFGPASLRADLMKLFVEQYPNNRHVVANHHVHIEATEWEAEDAVKVTVSGYGAVDPSGFVLKFDYVLGVGFKERK